MPAPTGKVKVEYSDPSGLFQLIASELQAHLPLRNLNWASSSRPTRSIDSLYVDLVPDEKSANSSNAKRTVSSNGNSDTPLSPTPSGEFRREESQAPKRERRHQIPGLRRTPYLRVFLLRCDDTDTYKATARRSVREWVKLNSMAAQGSSSSSSQDNHDAYEYMIVHVVLPDVHNGGTWPTKASASVLEKLKSDFNSSSRNSPDRIIQIPAMKSLQVQGITINPIPSGPAKEVFLQESNRAWDDLIVKMKSLILSSFDARVKQYEEDIKEKGMQRNMPGWNFCTFFVLKEGLARGFESVGLVDDALVGYDELSVELLSAIREDATKQSKLFREHTQDLLIEAEAALQGRELSSNRPIHRRLSTSFLSIDDKPYRELILANNISAFDFRSYVFARQIQLMLRLASLSGKALKANSSSADLTSTRDPVVLADICWRAKDFFSDMARVIRQDLKACFKAGSNASAAELKARFIVTENLITSWMYKGAMDVLNETRESNLPDVAVTDIDESTGASSSVTSTENPDPSSPTGDPGPTSIDTKYSQTRKGALSSASIQCKVGLSLESVRTLSTERAALTPGTSSLAAERAELYLIARRAFASVGERQGWKTSWPTADPDIERGNLDEVSLDDTTQSGQEQDGDAAIQISDSPMAGALDLAIRDALASRIAFYKHWEELSLLAFMLLEAAKVQKSVYFITADISAVRVRLGDYAYAAPFLRELGPKYAADKWHNLEAAVLDMYVFCLRKLNKLEEYVPAALQMMAKMIKAQKSPSKVPIMSSKAESTPFSNINLESVVDSSSALSKPIQVQLDDFFSELQLDECLWHSEENDEYGVALKFTSESPGNCRIDETLVKLVGTSESPARELLLSSGPHSCKQGANTVRVLSKTMAPDRYVLDSVVFTVGRIKFHRTYRSTSFVDRNLHTISNKVQLLIWPSPRACTVEASMYEVIHLSQPRAIVFTVLSNMNDITKVKLVTKSGTAGLRLHTFEAEIVDGDSELSNVQQPSNILMASIRPHTAVRVKVPYRIEADVKEISIRSELTYEVSGESFVYASSHRLMAQLPLGVNVQDIFKKNALFSKFAISTSSHIPIRVLNTNLAANEFYNVSTPEMYDGIMTVFAKQPASLVYRITKKAGAVVAAKKRLSLEIQYQCLDEQVIADASQQMENDLIGTRLHVYSMLLRTHLRTTLRRYTQEQDIEDIGLLDEIRLPSYSTTDWETVITAVSPEVQDELSIWLRKWHLENSIISIKPEGGAVIRRIEIPVEMPSLPVLHTASINIDKQPSSRLYTVGEMIVGELQISHTRDWSSVDSQTQDALSFVYELETSAESWLIAGQRRGYFLAREDEIKIFPVLLLPLRAGRLMLPIVEVRAAKEGEEGERSACETDYQDLGTAIEVAPGVTGVTLDVLTSSSGTLTGEVKVLGVERQKMV